MNESEERITATPPHTHDRWKFLRDVVVFQLKLFLSNVRDLALMPVSLVATLVDLVSRGKREGALFYKVLQWSSHSEKVIDVYSAIEHHDTGDFEVNSDYTVDAVIARLEGVLLREYEKGGTAASIKAAMDRAIDQLHTETSGTRDKATDLMTRAAKVFANKRSEIRDRTSNESDS